MRKMPNTDAKISTIDKIKCFILNNLQILRIRQNKNSIAPTSRERHKEMTMPKRVASNMPKAKAHTKCTK